MSVGAEKLLGRVKLRISTAEKEHAGCSNCGRLAVAGWQGKHPLVDGPLLCVEAPDATIRVCQTCVPRVGWGILGLDA